MPSRDPRIDDYIARAAPFAQPVLRHLRELVHEACPDVEETIKWGSPHFMYRGMLCGMAAFKAHATFGFWKGTHLVPDAADDAMGQFGRLTAVRDLPPKKQIIALVRKAMALNEQPAAPVRKTPATPRPAPEPSAAFAAALAADRRAGACFATLSPSQRREYVEWIDEAKREETRTRRLAQAIAWLAEGKTRNWKYENC
jgi:hypothetical protein